MNLPEPTSVDNSPYLDTIQLNRLEQAFRQWADGSSRLDVRRSRQRLLIVFLLIRYTGAKLNEVLMLNPFTCINVARRSVLYHSADSEVRPREVHISEALCAEIQSILADPGFQETLTNLFNVDPGFVRRKFYERAQACGFPKRLGGPEMIRKARAVELMQSNVPLPAVQMMLGHSTPNLTSAYLAFSETEMRQIARLFVEREANRKTSARNAFYGKIRLIQRGEIQARIELVTINGYSVTTVITNDSLEMLGLTTGKLITAEVKAPWVILYQGKTEPQCSAENRFQGTISRCRRGPVNTELVTSLSDGTQLCAIVTTESAQKLDFKPGDKVWAVFNSYAVVLHLD